MGKLEQEAKTKRKNRNIQNAILTTVETAGVIAVVAIAPNVAQLFKYFGYKPLNRHTEVIKRARENLVNKKLLIYENGLLHLTDRGKEVLQKIRIKDWKQEKPKKWDGRWRMLIFDIPEYRKTLRDKVRRTLLHIGFVRLQDSVWVYPYDCEDLVVLLKADFKVGKDLLYVIVESIENDKEFRKIFRLPPGLL